MTAIRMLVLAGLAGLACAAASQPGGDTQPATIHLDVNLVVVNVTVVDKDGRNVSGLGQEAFKLFVDDEPMDIKVFRGEDAPVTVGIVVDNSASMTGKRTEVIAAALAFARSSNPKDQMFVVHFNDRVKLGLPPDKPFTDSVAELEAALSHFAVAGTTALYDAAGLALSHISRATIDRKVLVIITDGGDNSSRAELADIVRLAQGTGVVFYSIGLFDDGDEEGARRILTQLAEITGGKAFFPSDVKDTTKVCVDIAKEIRSQYMLGFAAAEEGGYHNIQVMAQDPKAGNLIVRTRPGYVVATPGKP